MEKRNLALDLQEEHTKFSQPIHGVFMQRILIVLLIAISPFIAHGEELKFPILGCCTLDKNEDELYSCMKNVVDNDTYLAVFAKDGLSVIRIAKIKKKGAQDILFPWLGCKFFKSCSITETSCR